MKKIFIVLTLLLAANFVFAEAKFMGIPMGISEAEAEQNKKSYEEKILKAFSSICYRVSISYYYTESEPKQVCGINIRYNTNTNIRSMFTYNIRSYLLENNYKKINDGDYYNDDFLALTSSDSIDVFDRSKFKSAMKSLMK